MYIHSIKKNVIFMRLQGAIIHILYIIHSVDAPTIDTITHELYEKFIMI